TMRARAALIGSLTLVWSLSGAAQSRQPIPPSELEDQVLGWIKVYDYKGATKPITVDTRVYSPAQLSIAQLFANWMQASYLPKGALGDVLQLRNAKLSAYNQNTAAHPQAYGALVKLYTELMYGVNKKIEPLTSDAFLWGIEANGFYGEPIGTISTPERAYFTLPTFEQQGYGADLDQAADVSRHPVLRQFPTRFVRNSVSGNQRLVVLSKDYRHPFVTVTKGEYLQALEAAVARKYADEKLTIARDNKGNQRSIDSFTGYLNTNHEKRLAVLSSNKEKYQARLQETAEIWTQEPGPLLENYPDVFEGNGGTPRRLQVYTIDPRVIELSKTDAPQWIVMYWTAHLNDPISLSLHEAILNNVDFQYIYDYFFDPAKVKGQPYKPLRSPSFTETVVAGKPSATAAKNAADPAVVFFEDFSSSAVGKKPLNWKSTLDNTGASSVVTELKGLDGHWATMAGMEVTPTAMKTPLPRDFEVSYEVVAAQNYRWGAKGLIFKLSKTGGPASFLSVKIRPGFDGRQGEVEIEGRFPGAPDYMNGSKWVGAPGFSNNALNNRVTVTIKKNGDVLQVFVDQTKVAEYEKGIPPGLQFDAMSFDLQGNTADERMFISNIRIANH
ncbi:MAG: hypothetical protein ACRD1W_17545, partial [Vicinamibacterales bacterium]